MTRSLQQLRDALADRYRIEDELGAGGMATVYLAHDLKHDRRVAIKVLRSELAAIIGADRFLSEIRTTANLQHPHILPLFDSGVVAGTIFYAMPFVDGETLRDRLTREKQLPIRDALRIASEVADALGYAHRKGVIHRDIKPENILLQEGRVLVADFGIALAASRSDGGTRLTETGMSLGTPHYMSPEQALGQREVDGRTDIYALGCVLYEMLTGAPPFTGPTAQAIVARVVTERAAAPSTLRDTVPEALDDVVLNALEKLPADRFGNASEFVAALGGIALHPSAIDRRRAPAAGRRPERSRRLMVAIALATVLVAMASAAGGWRLSRVGLGAAWSPLHVQLALPQELRFNRPTLSALTFTVDGGSIVFAASDGTRRYLYRRPLDQPEPIRIAGTEGAAGPFVSPDGEWVGFWADGAIRKVPLQGGIATVVHDLRAAAATDATATGWGSELGAANATAYGATWLDDGALVYARFAGGLRAIAADGGQSRAVTELDSVAGEFAHRLPRTLPGGRALLFTVVGDPTAERVGVDAVILATGERRRILDDASDARYVAPGRLLFARSGSLYGVPFDARRLQLLGEPYRVLPDVMHAVGGNTPGGASGAAQYATSPAGGLAFLTGSVNPIIRTRIAWIRPDGRLEPFDVEASNYTSPRLSPDGRLISVFGRSATGRLTLYLLDVERNLITPLAPAVFGVWAPDGTGLVAARRDLQPDAQGLHWFPVQSGGEPEPLVRSSHPLWPSSFSADGRLLFYVETHPLTGNDIWMADLGSDEPPRPLLHTADDESYPVLSPDGRLLAYTLGSGPQREVFVRRFPAGGRPEQVSRSGGGSPVWSRDGARILYLGPGASAVLSTEVAYGPPIRIGRTATVAEVPRIRTTTPVGGIDIAADGRLLITVLADSLPPVPAEPMLQLLVNAPLRTGRP